jgi:hypothetical protein
MTHITKATLAVAFIAALVPPGLAQAKTYHDGYRSAHSMSYQTRTQRLFEGRNAAGFASFGIFNVAPSGRDAMVQSLGN